MTGLVPSLPLLGELIAALLLGPIYHLIHNPPKGKINCVIGKTFLDTESNIEAGLVKIVFFVCLFYKGLRTSRRSETKAQTT